MRKVTAGVLKKGSTFSLEVGRGGSQLLIVKTSLLRNVTQRLGIGSLWAVMNMVMNLRVP
jgi:hypothetical protein